MAIAILQLLGAFLYTYGETNSETGAEVSGSGDQERTSSRDSTMLYRWTTETLVNIKNAGIHTVNLIWRSI